MCIICIEFQKSLITINEARGVLTEMVPALSQKHIREINEMLEEAENSDET